MGTDRLRRLDDLLIGGRLIAIADIVHDRAGEDKTVLHHHAHLAAQGMDRHPGNVLSVNEHLPSADIVKA